MKFVPYHDKIEVKPIEKETPFVYENAQLVEAGEVIALGSGVDAADDPKVGDIIFFLGYGCWETAEMDGTKHYVVPNRSEFILGRYVAE